MADFTVSAVLEWARTKPAAESYEYNSNDNCALCQFLRETGRCASPSVGGWYWRDTTLPYHRNPFSDEVASALHAGTFGGLVERLEQFAPSTPVTQSDWVRIDAYLTAETVSA